LKSGLQGLALLAGVVLGGALFHALGRAAARFDPQSPGLGRETTAISSSRFAGRDVSAYPQATAAIAAQARAMQQEGRKVALWIGGSQLHAINNFREGEQLAVVQANALAAGRGATGRYVQISQANANFQEMLAFYVRFRQAGTVPDRLILAMAYDDLRERGLRWGALDGLSDALAAARQIGGPGVEALRAEAVRQAAGQAAAKAPVERNAIADTPQEKLEDALTAAAEGAWPAYRDRSVARAMLETEGRARMLRAIYGRAGKIRIDVPEDVASQNRQALESIVRIARADATRVLIYVQPYRPGEECFWYDRAAYEAFLAEMKAWCAAEGVQWADLSDLVAADQYGYTSDGRPDVFHFRQSGHRLLAEAIDRLSAAEGR
jgi:hypothetical protein